MFERANVASDHQQLLMTVFKTVARKHGMECLFHEKPFTGVNGSGKHVNFSLGNSELGSLFVPGDTPHENAQFLVFCAAAIRAVHKYSGLLRASVASATNDHRLGANEAPPAIISIFLGDQLADVFEQLAKGPATSSKGRGQMQIGVSGGDSVTFSCGQAHDALVGLLLVRALNVRAVLREQEMTASRGVLSAPSAQK